MNPTPDHPDHPQDPAVSRLYHTHAGGEPPVALDAAILSTARRATQTKTARRPWWRGLQAPLALAATVTLAVGLSLIVDRHPPQVDTPAPAQRAEPVAAPAATPSLTPAEQKAEAQRNAQPSVATRAKAAREMPESLAKPEPAPGRDAAASVLPSPPAAAPAALAPPTAPTATAATAGAPAASAEATANLADRSEARSAPAAVKALPMAKREAAAPKAPEIWIEDIRRLKQQGQTEEVTRQLDAFRRAYPDYKLPDDLR